MHLLRETARPEWIDYNGHLYDGYYAVIFAMAVDEFLVAVGLDAETRRETKRTIYTLETHVRFLRELKEGAPLQVSARLIEFDAKRARLFLTLTDTARDVVAATSEQLLMSIDQSGEAPRSAPWLAASLAVLEALRDQQAGEPVPEAAGQGIRLKR